MPKERKSVINIGDIPIPSWPQDKMPHPGELVQLSYTKLSNTVYIFAGLDIAEDFLYIYAMPSADSSVAKKFLRQLETFFKEKGNIDIQGFQTNGDSIWSGECEEYYRATGKKVYLAAAPQHMSQVRRALRMAVEHMQQDILPVPHRKSVLHLFITYIGFQEGKCCTRPEPFDTTEGEDNHRLILGIDHAKARFFVEWTHQEDCLETTLLQLERQCASDGLHVLGYKIDNKNPMLKACQSYCKEMGKSFHRNATEDEVYIALRLSTKVARERILDLLEGDLEDA